MKIQSLRIDSFDPGAMEETIKDCSFEHVQLEPGLFHGDLLAAESASQRMDYGHYNLSLHVRGSMPDRRITLGFVMQSPENTSLNGTIIDGPTLVVLREGEMLDYRLAADTKWMAFQVAGEAMEQLGIELSYLPRAPVSQTRLPRLQAMERELHAAIATLAEISEPSVEGIVAPDQFGRKAFADIMDQFQGILGALAPTSLRHSPRRQEDYRLFRRAVDYIDAGLTGELQIGMLCRELDTNWRSLERAFARLLGVTPKRYLQLARLARARRLLVQSRQKGLTVSEVAMACGINHLGRFSQAYRSIYGETPSQTLRH